MSEILNKVNKKAAATMAVVAIGAGIAGEAKAASLPQASQPGIEAVHNDGRLSIDEITSQSVERLKAGQPINFYRGAVDIVNTKTGKTKVEIDNPIIIYRNGATAQELDFASTHPRSKFWAIGYIKPGVEGGNLGNANLVLLPYNNGDNNFVFLEQASKVPLTKPTIDLEQFTKNSDGSLDLANPLDNTGLQMLDQYLRPLSVGELVAPVGPQV